MFFITIKQCRGVEGGRGSARRRVGHHQSPLACRCTPRLRCVVAAGLLVELIECGGSVFSIRFKGVPVVRFSKLALHWVETLGFPSLSRHVHLHITYMVIALRLLSDLRR